MAKGTTAGRAAKEAAARRQRVQQNARPAQGQNLDAAQIAQTGRDQAAQNVTFLGQQLGGLSDNFAGQQQRQIDAQATRLDNQYTADARTQINGSLGAAGQVETIGNNAASYGATAGQQINNLAPLAQTQANDAAANINALAPQVIGIGDTTGAALAQQATDARAQGAGAAATINALAPQVIGIGDQYMGQIGGIGNMLGYQARQSFDQSGPTSIEQELYRQGQSDLALGRSLSAEETRDATQSARQGMAARGMATGMASLGVELLNRNRFATQREAERRKFAADANNLREKNVMDRRDAAGRLAEAGGRTLDAAGRIGMAGRDTAGKLYDTAGRVGMLGTELGGRLTEASGRVSMDGRDTAGRLYDTAGRLGVLGTSTAAETLGLGARTTMSGQEVGGRLLADAGRMRQTGGGMIADLDPYARAINPGLSLGQASMGAAGNFIGNNLTGMTDLAGNTASFNTNRQDTAYNNYMNNQAYMNAAKSTADAYARYGNSMSGAYGGSGGSTFGNVLGGAVGGAAAGASLGPWGMAGGAVLGGALSLFNR